jgi:hypothetical protein
MKKYIIASIALFSCYGKKTIDFTKYNCLNSFKEYEISKRGTAYILRTDSLNFRILENDSIVPILTISNKDFKKGILSETEKMKITSLVECIRNGDFIQVERNKDNFEIILNGESEPLIISHDLK